MYFDPKMTLDEYEDFKLQDEINIGYDVEDDDLPVTTKSRLNAILEEFAPERRVFQKNWQWFVSDFLGMAEPFVDGMTV